MAFVPAMPDYVAPGVHIEIARGPRPIQGVPTSITAFVGETKRGPIHPTFVTSFSEYSAEYGGSFGADKYMPDAIAGYFANGGKQAFVCRIVAGDAVAARRSVCGLSIAAIGPGAWGNAVFVKLTEGTRARRSADDAGTFRLQVAYWPEPPPDDMYPDPFDPSVAPGPVAPILEEFDNLVWNEPGSPDHYLKRLNGNSSLVIASPNHSREFVGPTEAPFGALTGGKNGSALTADDYRGNNADPLFCSGLAALKFDADVALVAAPAASGDVINALIQHCEQMRYRFAIIDAEQGQSDTASLDPRAAWDTSYAAFYYPWISIADPQSATPRLVPPSGHVAGIFARTDIERGVWKAPANEPVSGATSLEFEVSNATQDMLNSRGVNAIRQFPGRGIRLWGARTLSTDSLWKYVSVRRLFIFLERSIAQGIQWAVFEPNNEALWQQIEDRIREFLRSQWRAGALMGRTESEAFMVACDRSTMTPEDILNGRLVCEIGVAPARPAEFIIFRILQDTAEAQ